MFRCAQEFLKELESAPDLHSEETVAERQAADAVTFAALLRAARFTYRGHTVLEGTGGLDGTFEDVDAEEIARRWDAGDVATAYDDHAILVPTDHLDPDLVREAVTRWCRSRLGRDIEISFDLD